MVGGQNKRCSEVGISDGGNSEEGCWESIVSSSKEYELSGLSLKIGKLTPPEPRWAKSYHKWKTPTKIGWCIHTLS